MATSGDRPKGDWPWRAVWGWVILGVVMAAILGVVAGTPTEPDAGLVRVDGAALVAESPARALGAPLWGSLVGGLQVLLLAVVTALIGVLTAWISRKAGVSIEAQRTARLMELAELAVLGAEQEHAAAAASASAIAVAETAADEQSKAPARSADYRTVVQAKRKHTAVDSLTQAATREGLKIGESLARHLIEAALGKLKKVL